MTFPGSDATAPSGAGGYPDALAAPPAEADTRSALDFGDALAAAPAPVGTLADADSLAPSVFERAGEALAGPVAGADPLLGAAALAGEPPYPNGTADSFTDFAITTVPEPVMVMPPPPPPVPAPPSARPPRQRGRRSERRARQQTPPAGHSQWAPSQTADRPTAAGPVRASQQRSVEPQPPRGWGATYTPPPERPPARPGRGTPTGTVPWQGQANRYQRPRGRQRQRKKKSPLARIVVLVIIVLVFAATRISSCVSDLTDDLRDRGAPAAPADPGPAQR